MNKVFWRFTFFTIILVFPLFLFGQTMKIDAIYKTNNFLCVSAHLDGKLPDDIFNYLKNGLKITIVYYIEIKDRRPFYYIFDKSIVSKTVKKIVTYNLWEKTYYLQYNKKLFKIHSREAFVNEIGNIKNIKLLTAGKIAKLDSPFIRIKSKLESIKLFPPLSWIFDLVSVRGFETEWTEKDLK